MTSCTALSAALVVLVSCAHGTYDSNVINRCPQPSEDVPIPNAHYYTHPRDCKKFVSCSYGLPHVLACPELTVFNDEVMACVWREGPHYKGAKCEGAESKEQPSVCSDPETKLVAHPTICQRYFNCSDTSSRDYSFLEPFEDECPYPDLFDPVALRCVPYMEARCGTGAVVGQEPCDYVKNQCVAAHCEPCYSRAPSCIGKPDGPNEHPFKLWTPHHVVCENNRSIDFKWCEYDNDTPFRMIFSPEKKTCVTMWEVPREHRGFRPECLEDEDEGYYITPESDKVFYRCPGAEVFFCEEGQRFNIENQACTRYVTEEPKVTGGVAQEETTLAPEKPVSHQGLPTEEISTPAQVEITDAPEVTSGPVEVQETTHAQVEVTEGVKTSFNPVDVTAEAAKTTTPVKGTQKPVTAAAGGGVPNLFPVHHNGQ